MNILDVNRNFQECLDKYDVKIKENTDINDLCINFFECFNIEKIKNISEFEQFKTFAITLIENNYFFEILNIEYSFFIFYKDIFIQMVNNFSETIFDNILAEKFLHLKSKECYKMLVKNIVNEYKIIEEDIGKNTENWAVDRINIIEKLIITLGIIEFKYLKTPIQVITNEYVKLAKIFKDEEAGKFVNGVLDKILKIYNTKNDN
jgi:N utilization substance protein B